MLKVTFLTEFTLRRKVYKNYIVEFHRSLDDARLRALALNWTIATIENIKGAL